MSETNFKHPLRKEDGAEYSTKEIFARLVNENTGHYILGNHQRWHGGIHYSVLNKMKKEQSDKDKKASESSDKKGDTSNKEKAIVNNVPVYAIGGGKLIAYRLNKKYKESTYKNEEEEEWKLDYSTSFCLIKHELEVKKEEPPKITTPTTETENKPWVLTTATHKQRVRSGDSFSKMAANWAKKYGTTATSTVETEMKRLNPNITDVSKINIGDTIIFPHYEEPKPPPVVIEETPKAPEKAKSNKLTFYSLYMHLAAYEDYDKKSETITIKATDLKVRAATNIKTMAGSISTGATLECEAEKQEGNYRFILGKITSGQVTDEDNKTTATAGDKVWVPVTEAWVDPVPKKVETIIARPSYWDGKDESNSFTLTFGVPTVCSPPVPVTADTLIGHFGLYETPDKPSGGRRSCSQVHMEIFADNEGELKKFLSNEAGLFQGKKYAKLKHGTKVYASIKDSEKPERPKDEKPPAPTSDKKAEKKYAVSTVLNHTEIYELNSSDPIKNSKGEEFYSLSSSNKMMGFVKKADVPEVLCQHDWEKLGFTIVEEEDDNADGFIDTEKMPQFFRDIYKEIDRSGTKVLKTYGDGEVTKEELKNALRFTHLRDKWSKLVAKHPTEWKAKSDDKVWKPLDKHLDGKENGENIKTHEKERIDELIFWGKVTELKKPSVFHFHPVAFVGNLNTKSVCPIDPKYRSHFVIHCTDGNMTKAAIENLTQFNIPNKKLRSRAHKYIMADGEVVEIWPFTEKNVWATKIESRKNLKGQMFHVELNYGSPTLPTEKQYQVLADLYIEASNIEGCWPIIVPHIEVDRGILSGHKDPTDFDYNKFYQILKDRGVPIDSIPHFEHDRYWSYPRSKEPFATDTNSWPPILKGNPH